MDPDLSTCMQGTDLENNMAGYGGPTELFDSRLSELNQDIIPSIKIGKNERDLRLFPTVFSHRLVAPVVQIYSIFICMKQHELKEGEKCEIYGSISVVDENGDEFVIFDRERDKPECVDNHSKLTLSALYFLRSAEAQVRMNICDKAHKDVVIARGVTGLFGSLAVTNCVVVDGDNGGFATLRYSTFPYAVTATVQVLYFSKDHDFDIFKDIQKPDYDDIDYDSDGIFLEEHFDMYDNANYDALVCGTSIASVYGTVTAGYGSVSDVCLLFRLPPEQCLLVRSGGSIELSRSVLAVPAYSSLKIEVDLSDGNTQLPIGRSSVKFIPQDDSLTYKKDIVGESGRIRVRVTWDDAYQQLDRARELKLLSNGIPPAMSNNYYPMIEVFSICVFGFEPLRIYGIITASGYCIYNRGKNCPQQCSGLVTSVELDCHRSFDLLDKFGMRVELKDVEKKSKIIYGRMIWQPYNLEPGSKWLDRRLCSLIRGDRAFAAVHYEIFSDALAAKVDVKPWPLAQSFRVSGMIIARYGTHDYSNSYDKEYYQSVLFLKGANDDLPMLTRGSSLPLSKSVVAVPRNSSLIIEAEIAVTDVDDNNTQYLRGSLQLTLGGVGEFSGTIERHSCCIVLSVKCDQGFCY